jgi:hypothetical protein
MSERIQARDATTKPLTFRLHLQNASRVTLDSASNKALRKMLRDPEVLDWLEESLEALDEIACADTHYPSMPSGFAGDWKVLRDIAESVVSRAENGQARPE